MRSAQRSLLITPEAAYVRRAYDEPPSGSDAGEPLAPSASWSVTSAVSWQGGLPLVFEDGNSAVSKFENTTINLLNRRPDLAGAYLMISFPKERLTAGAA